jgi:hypothetical protein
MLRVQAKPRCAKEHTRSFHRASSPSFGVISTNIFVKVINSNPQKIRPVGIAIDGFSQEANGIQETVVIGQPVLQSCKAILDFGSDKMTAPSGVLAMMLTEKELEEALVVIKEKRYCVVS